MLTRLPLLLLFLPCCASPPPRQAIAAHPADAGTATSVDAEVPAPPLTASPPPPPAEEAKPERPVLTFEEGQAWLAKHGVTTPDAEHRIGGCEAVKVGMPSRDALWCLGGSGPMAGSFDSGESLFPLTVRIAEGHALRNVLELPIAAGALSRDFDDDDKADPNEGNYILLEARLAPDGSTVTVQEKVHPKAKCAAVVAEHTALRLVKHRKVVEAACRSVGTYVWRGNRFVRGAPPAPAPSSPTPSNQRGNSSSF
jgi:hypothetical protein